MEIVTKKFQNFTIRTILIKDEPWFVAKDISELLGFSSKGAISNALKDLDSDERGLFEMNTSGGVQNMGIVSESGLYSLIIRSRKPIAKPFQKWVTHDVLPQIRKTGSYQLSPETEKTETVSEISEVEKLSITKELEILKFKLENYGYSQKEKIEVSNTLFRKVGSDELPIPKKIETHSFQNSFSLTKLLEKHDIQIRTADFNMKLAEIGIIEKRGKNWFILNLEFGINEIYENNTNPKYFEETFEELLKLVFPPKVDFEKIAE